MLQNHAWSPRRQPGAQFVWKGRFFVRWAQNVFYGEAHRLRAPLKLRRGDGLLLFVMYWCRILHEFMVDTAVSIIGQRQCIMPCFLSEFFRKVFALHFTMLLVRHPGHKPINSHRRIESGWKWIRFVFLLYRKRNFFRQETNFFHKENGRRYAVVLKKWFVSVKRLKHWKNSHGGWTTQRRV